MNEGSPSPGRATDTLLARLASQGDDSACRELIRRYQDRIYEVAYSYARDWDQAWDITQETFLKMWEAVASGRMPLSGGALSAGDLALLRQWILDGALDN
jgi:sigma-70-like protein